MDIKVAVAIPTIGRDEVLVDTIEEVLKQSPGPDEVIVVDQSSDHDQEIQARLDAWADAGVIIYLRPDRSGLPFARNLAARAARSDVIIFIDDDVRLSPGFVEAHRRCYEREGTAAVAGRVEQRLGWLKIRRPRDWPRVLDFKYFRLDGETRVEGIATFIGCNHSVRLSALRRLGGYDEGYPGVALREETDLAIRLFLSGETIVYEPEAALAHLQAPSGGCRPRRITDISGAVSLVKFAVKFRRPLGSAVVWREIWSAFRLAALNKQVLRSPLLAAYNGARVAGYVATARARTRRNDHG